MTEGEERGGKEKNYESHGKLHGGRKCERIKPLTVQRNA